MPGPPAHSKLWGPIQRSARQADCPCRRVGRYSSPGLDDETSHAPYREDSEGSLCIRRNTKRAARKPGRSTACALALDCEGPPGNGHSSQPLLPDAPQSSLSRHLRSLSDCAGGRRLAGRAQRQGRLSRWGGRRRRHRRSHLRRHGCLVPGQAPVHTCRAAPRQHHKRGLRDHKDFRGPSGCRLRAGRPRGQRQVPRTCLYGADRRSPRSAPSNDQLRCLSSAGRICSSEQLVGYGMSKRAGNCDARPRERGHVRVRASASKAVRD